MITNLKLLLVFGLALALLGARPSTALAAGAVSAADRTFVAGVSQGGMFEVAAGTLAKRVGNAPNVRDQGNTEMHDHQLVGARLAAIAAADGIPVAATLNAHFRAKLTMLIGLSGAAFDNAFIREMKTIHALDGAAFAKEANGGTNPALRTFAAQTYLIVQRHIGALDAVGPESI